MGVLPRLKELIREPNPPPPPKKKKKRNQGTTLGILGSKACCHCDPFSQELMVAL